MMTTRTRTTFQSLEPRRLLAAADVVAYAGGAGDEQFGGAMALSDGTVLVAGAGDDLAWLPAGTPVTALTGPGVDAINSGGGANTGFLLRFSADLATILGAYAFPDGKVETVDRIRSTEVPGEPTGTIYVSGQRRTANAADDGYYVVRLDGNAVAAPIAGASWAHNVVTRGAGDHERIQPWDVRSDGRVVYAMGDSFGANWTQIGVLDAVTGQPSTMEHWPNQWGSAGERANTRASAYPGTVSYSGVVLKLGRGGGLRSYTQADFDGYGVDENGGPRKGKYPDDYYFNGPQNVAGTGTGGYTGYKPGSQPTARVGGIAVDRRTNDLYYGYSYQSRLPDGNPDFEPAVVAMDASGQTRWWARLYREFTDANANGRFDAGEPANSSPDQYVDGLAVDYANDRLAVLARTHGNNVINFWRGTALVASPGAGSFQQQFTGTNGNIHLGWIGKYALADGRIRAATYVGDYGDPNSGQGTPFASGNLAGWPSPNAGWPDLNTTRSDSYQLAVDAAGNVYTQHTSRRAFTTADAYQSMRKPGEGASAWSPVARVYASDLSSVLYSTVLRQPWASTDSNSPDTVNFRGFAVAPGGMIAVGWNDVDATTGAAQFSPAPTQNLGTWGRSAPTRRDAILAKFNFAAAPATVDTVAPTIAATAFAVDEAAARVRVVFSEGVVGLTAGDLVVTRVADGATVGVADFAYDAATRTARFDLATPAGGTLLADGDYAARLPAGSFADAAGNALVADATFAFFSLAGDVNRDRVVGFDDLLVLAQNYGATAGRTWSTGDLTYDGAVGFDDLLVLAQRYGQGIALQQSIALTTAGAPANAKRRERGLFADSQPLSS